MSTPPASHSPLPAERAGPDGAPPESATALLRGIPDEGADWQDLLHATIAELLQSPGLPALPPLAGLGASEALKLLGQLRARLSQERGRATRIEGELAQAQGTLAQARTVLTAGAAEAHREHHHATHDALTLLPNRRLFSQRLEQALAPGDRPPAALAVFFLDLNVFRQPRHRPQAQAQALPAPPHGQPDPGDLAHQSEEPLEDEAADEMLRVVAGRLRNALRADDLVCRMGGEEFACLVSGPMERAQLSHLACKLFEAVAVPVQVGALQFSVRPSIGIARCPGDGDAATPLLKHADAAMYRARRGQLGHAFFDRRSDA